jgi:hypothetical protein
MEAEFVALAADEYEAALLGDTPRAGVVDVTGEVDALQSMLVRAPRDQCLESAVNRTITSS